MRQKTGNLLLPAENIAAKFMQKDHGPATAMLLKIELAPM
jgi:hypothetical protein